MSGDEQLFENPGPRKGDLIERMHELDGVSVTLGPLVKAVNDIYERKGAQQEIEQVFDVQVPNTARKIASHLSPESGVTEEMIVGKMTHFLAFYCIQALFTTAQADNVNTERKEDFLHAIMESTKLPRGGEPLDSLGAHPDALLVRLFQSPLGYKNPSNTWSYFGSSLTDSEMVSRFRGEGRSEWWLTTFKALLPKLYQSSRFGVLGEDVHIKSDAIFAYFSERMRAGLITVTTDGHILANFVRNEHQQEYVKNYLRQKGITSNAAVREELRKIVTRSLIALHPVALTSINVHRAVITNRKSELKFVEGKIGGGTGLFIVTSELQQLRGSSTPLSEALKEALLDARNSKSDAIACGCPLAYSPLMREAMRAVCNQLVK